MKNYRARVAYPGSGAEAAIAALRGWDPAAGVIGTTDANGNLGSVVFEFRAEDEEAARRALDVMLAAFPNGHLEALEPGFGMG